MFSPGQNVKYNRPQFGWVNATVIEQNRKDLVISVEGQPLPRKIKLAYVNDSVVR